MKQFPLHVGLLTALTGCAQGPEGNPDIVELEPREKLIRLSVDLLGVHPTERELLSIESNPDYYENYVDHNIPK